MKIDIRVYFFPLCLWLLGFFCETTDHCDPWGHLLFFSLRDKMGTGLWIITSTLFDHNLRCHAYHQATDKSQRERETVWVVMLMVAKSTLGTVDIKRERYNHKSGRYGLLSFLPLLMPNSISADDHNFFCYHLSCLFVFGSFWSFLFMIIIIMMLIPQLISFLLHVIYV